MNTPVVALAAGAFALALGACGPGDALTCGPGAVAENGACVSLLVEPVCAAGTTLDEEARECRPDVSCGGGTVYDPTARACVPAAACGPGTHLDDATKTCLPDATCGEGTVYDPETRTCAPTFSCGAGTHVDEAAGACVPDDRCGEGTSYHPVTHLCVPAVTCGPGLVAHESVCLTATDVVALGADVVEAVVEANDPAFGGAAEPLPIAAIGSSSIFAGTIGRPVDLDADGDEDQDVDAWGFTGTAGQLLRVRLLDDGLGTPAFRVVGPDGFVRTSALGVVHEPLREVVLPVDGDYRIEVAPVSALRGDGPPVGSPEHGYVGIVEELPWPALRGLEAPALPASAAESGTLFSMLDDFFVVRSAPDAALLLSATAAAGATLPALMLFDAGGRFAGEVAFEDDDEQGHTAVAPAWASVENGVIVVVDWLTSDGFDAPYTIAASTAPTYDLGDVLADTTVTHDDVVVPGRFAAGYAFAVEGGELVTVHLPGASSPRYVLVSPDGPVLRDDTLERSALSFYARETGAWRLVVANGSTSDTTIAPTVASTTPHAAGALGPGDAPLTASGPLLRTDGALAQRAVMLVETTAPALLRAAVDFDLGMPEFDVYRVEEGGALVDRRRAGEDDVATVRALRVEPGTSMVVLDPGSLSPPNPPVRGWRLHAEADPLPDVLDVEPNDDAASAVLLEPPPVQARGTIADDEFDVWAFQADPALGPGEVLEIQVENLTSAATTSFEIHGAADVVVRDASSARATAVLLTAADGAGPFTLHVEGTVDDGVEYVVSIARRAVALESEPNDDLAAADDVSLAPTSRVERFGTTTKGAPDVVRVTPTAPLPAGAAIRARLENLYELNDLHLALLDGVGLPVRASEHEDAVILATTTGTAPIAFRIEGDSTFRIDDYRLVVDVLGPFEVEPNDEILTAPTLVVPADAPVELWSQGHRFEDDVFRIEAAGAPMRVSWENAIERGDIAVRILDGDGVEQQLATEYQGSLDVLAPGAAFYVQATPAGFGSDDRLELVRIVVDRL